MVVKEGSNVTLKCAATGSPTPTITWRREGGEPISLSGGVEGNCCVLIVHRPMILCLLQWILQTNLKNVQFYALQF